MKLILFKIFFAIILIVAVTSLTTLSYAGKENSHDNTLEYLEKVEGLILGIVPEGQKEQVKKLFDQLREFLKKELEAQEEEGVTKETSWEKGAKLNTIRIQ
jgi:ABC-type phosphate/phosphonate transport system substrate-binding protein